MDSGNGAKRRLVRVLEAILLGIGAWLLVSYLSLLEKVAKLEEKVESHQLALDRIKEILLKDLTGK
jgi:hypothetical protein